MLGRAVTFNVLGQVGSLAVGFVGSLLLARWLGPSERGLLGVMYSAATIAGTVLSIGIPHAVMTFSSRRDAERSALLGNAAVHGLVMAAIVVPIAWIFHAEIADAIARGDGGRGWALAGVLVPVTFLSYIGLNLTYGLQRFGFVNAMLVVSKVVFLAAVVVLLGFAGMGVTGGVLAMCASSAVLIVGGFHLTLRLGRPRLDRRLFGSMLRFGGRVQPGMLFQTANYRLDVFILQLYRPLSHVGYYVVAQIVAELVGIIAAGFQNSLNVMVSNSGGATENTLRSLRHHTMLSATAIVGMAVFGPILLLLYGPSFRPAIVPMLVLLPAMWFIGTGQVITGDLRGRGRPGVSSVIAGCAMLLTIGLDFVLIPPYGVIGAAIASVCAYTFFGCAAIVVLSRIVHVSPLALVLPTRADVMVYPAALRAVRARLRSQAAVDAA